MAKYTELAKLLKDEIERSFTPGDKFYTQKELIEKYGLSFSTVERALGLLREERLISCTQGSGTYVLKGPETGGHLRFRNVYIMIEHSYHDIASNYYYGGLYNGIKSVIINTDVSTVIASFDNWKSILDRGGYDGVILVAPGREHEEMVRACAESGVPAVVTGARWPNIGIPVVDTDVAEAVRTAARYLANKGHRSAGYVTARHKQAHDEIRREAFFSSAAELGIEIKADWVIEAEYDKMSGDCREHLARVFSSAERPTALMFSSLLLGSNRIISELTEMGLAVPEDVSIIGCDDPKWGASTEPALTALEQPLLELGRRVMTCLMQRMDGSTVFPKLDLLPVALIERNSVAKRQGF